MFTGIIEDIGIVKSIEKNGKTGKMTLQSSLDMAAVSIGDSIAVDGVCLTVVAREGSQFVADISEETFKCTTLGERVVGDGVNLEPALTPQKPLGGHMVSGHVDGVGTVRAIKEGGEYVEIEFNLPREFMMQIVRKGSIAVDGISLTVADIRGDGFMAAIIPHTLKETTLSDKKVGSKVNMETDIIGKYVERYLVGDRGGSITEGFLEDHGFKKK